MTEPSTLTETEAPEAAAQPATQARRVLDIDRIEAPTREHFETHYLNKNRPVVITGVADKWGALEKWSVDYLKSVAGDSEVTVHYREDADFGKWYRLQEEREDRRMPFGEVLDLLSGDPGDRRYYMTEHSLRQVSPELVSDVDVSRYVDLPPPWEPLLFVGFDTCMPGHFHGSTEAFLCQIEGEKTVTLFSPEQYNLLYPRHWYQKSPLFSELDGRAIQADTVDLEQYPKYAEAVPMRFPLRPGDILFIPVHWWHITSVPTFQVSVTFFWKARFSNWTFPVPGMHMCAREAHHQVKRVTRFLTGRRMGKSASRYDG